MSRRTSRPAPGVPRRVMPGTPPVTGCAVCSTRRISVWSGCLGSGPRSRYPPVRFMVLWGLTGVGGRAQQTRRAPGGYVAMLREDQLFLAEDGTPWVRTDPAPDALDDDIRWHRPPQREYDRPAGGGFLWLGGAPAAVCEGGVVEGAWWAVGGLAVGVLGTLLVRNAAARRGAGPPWDARRRELIDL